MVLQRDLADPGWGISTPGAEVRVEFAGQKKSAVADAQGHWMAKLDPLPASNQGRPLSVTAADQTTVFQNVLVGEVWLCSGQSNMEKPIGEQRGQKPTTNWQDEIAKADHPLIRLLGIPKVKKASEISARWEVCTPDTIASEHFSACAYFFGRKIQQETNVPVGLIHSSWGGTRIEPWTPSQAFADSPTLKDFASSEGHGPATRITGPAPSSLYQAMIEPLVPFGIRGAIWYQGESNVMAHDGPLYLDKMRALIGGWRSAWGEGDFPFYYVQLAPYAYTARKADNSSAQDLPLVWEAQREALAIPHTGMAVITDLVDNFHDIHPTKKREVGDRLALWALANEYGKNGLEFSGPLFKRVDPASSLILFDHADGLKTSDGKPPTGFEMMGPGGQFVPVDVMIKNNAIVLPDVPGANKMLVRFAWSETAVPNLVNGAGLPASPFQSRGEK